MMATPTAELMWIAQLHPVAQVIAVVAVAAVIIFFFYVVSKTMP